MSKGLGKEPFKYLLITKAKLTRGACVMTANDKYI